MAKRLLALQVAQYAAQAGFPASAIAEAVAYAGIESSWDPTARSPTGCIGLWQICGTSVHGDLTDPLTNAKAAYAKWKACSGGSFACDWTPYDQGSSNPNWNGYYQQALAVAAHAVAPSLLQGETRSDLNGIEQGFATDITQTYLASQAVLGMVPAVADIVSQAQSALSSALDALGPSRRLLVGSQLDMSNPWTAATTLQGLAQRLQSVVAVGDQAVSTVLASAEGGFPAEIAQWWELHVGQPHLATAGSGENASRALIDFLKHQAAWLDSGAAAIEPVGSHLQQAPGTLEQLGNTLTRKIITMGQRLDTTSDQLWTMEQENMARFGPTGQDPRLALSKLLSVGREDE
jgi:hypothetical protein